MTIGPLQLLLVKFADEQRTKPISEALKAVRKTGIIRLVDMLYVYKDPQGVLHSKEISDLPDAAKAEYGILLQGLLGMRVAHKTAGDVDKIAAAMSLSTGDFGLSSEQVQRDVASLWRADGDVLARSRALRRHGGLSRRSGTSLFRRIATTSSRRSTTTCRSTGSRIEQLAGDLFAERRPSIRRSPRGYNRLLQTSHEGGAQQKEYLADLLRRPRAQPSSVWMGRHIGCAQCHDHRYDPYTQSDFYASPRSSPTSTSSRRRSRAGRRESPTRRDRRRSRCTSPARSEERRETHDDDYQNRQATRHSRAPSRRLDGRQAARSSTAGVPHFMKQVGTQGSAQRGSTWPAG